MPGVGGILSGSKEGEGYVPNEDFWADGAYSADIEGAAEQASGEAFLGDLQTGGQIGSAGGIVGGIIGMVVGAIVGGVDAALTKDAVQAQLEEEQERRAKLEAEIEDTMNMRDEIEQNLSALLHPLEQKFRTNMRMFGAQSRAQGLTGAQALSAQVLAEDQYRQQVGPHLASVMTEARGLAREQAFAKLKAIETREGIILERERMQLQQDMAAAQARSGLISGIASTAVNVGTGIGQAVGDAAGQQNMGMTGGGIDPLGGMGGMDFTGGMDMDSGMGGDAGMPTGGAAGIDPDIGMTDLGDMGMGAGGLV